MPIRPEHRWLYPIDWRELSAFVRFQRARGRCERCGRPHGAKVQHLGDGRWFDEERCWRDDRGRAVRGLASPDRLPRQLRMTELAGEPVLPRTRVVLASAHLTMIRQQPLAQSGGPVPALPPGARPPRAPSAALADVVPPSCLGGFVPGAYR